MIRALNSTDAEDFARVRLDGLRRHPEAFATTAADWEVASAEARSQALTERAHAPDDRVWGAFADGVLVGVVGFKREARATVHHKGSVWGFYVHPEQRGRGLGTQLLEALSAHARALDGVDYVRAVVTVADEAALRRFERAGFTRYGLEVGGLRRGEQPYDQAYLRLDLR